MCHILLIDDEPHIRNLWTFILLEEGYGVHTACDGAEGLSYFEEHGADLVITDIVMPEKNGIEALVEIKRSSPDTKVLVVSGGGAERVSEVLLVAENLGADAVLKKPVAIDDLCEMVAQLTQVSPELSPVA